ncbi:hypothetical protein AgCh_017349 [Apium graveolens]
MKEDVKALQISNDANLTKIFSNLSSINAMLGLIPQGQFSSLGTAPPSSTLHSQDIQLKGERSTEKSLPLDKSKQKQKQPMHNPFPKEEKEALRQNVILKVLKTEALKSYNDEFFLNTLRTLKNKVKGNYSEYRSKLQDKRKKDDEDEEKRKEQEKSTSRRNKEGEKKKKEGKKKEEDSARRNLQGKEVKTTS